MINLIKSQNGKIKFFYKFLFFLVKYLFIFIFVFFIAFIFTLKKTSPNIYKPIIEKQLKEILKKDVKINGNLSWTLFSFYPVIEVQNVSIANAIWAKNKDLVKSKSILLSINIKELFNKNISVNKIIIKSPVINLEENIDGSKNWKYEKIELSKNHNTNIKSNQKEIIDNDKFFPDLKFDVKQIIVSNVKFNYYRDLTNEKYFVHIDHIVLNSNNINKPLNLNFKTTFKDKVIHGNISTLPLFTLINNKNNDIPITAVLNLNGINANIIGNIYNIHTATPKFVANVDITSSNFVKALFPNTTITHIFPLNISTKLTAKDKVLNFEKFKFSYFTADISGDIKVKFNEKPEITANLILPFFDIPNMFSKTWEKNYFYLLTHNINFDNNNEPVNPDPKAFTNVPLPAAEFDIANVDLNLFISKLKAMPEMPITNIDLKLKVKDGIATIAPLTFDYMDGKGKIHILSNNNNGVFNAIGRVEGQNINVGKIVDSTGVKNIVKDGDTDLDIIFRSYGKNLEIFMENIEGYITGHITKPMITYKIENSLYSSDFITDFIKKMGRIDKNSAQNQDNPKSKINCLVVNLNVKDGKTITSRGIGAETDIANIVVDGMANLGDEHLDVSILSTTKEGFRISSGLLELIKIYGALASPDIVLNRSGVYNQIAKTYITGTLLGLLTSGIPIVNVGLAYFTKSWFTSILEDSHPCQTASKGKLYLDEKYKNHISQEEYRNIFDNELLKYTELTK